MAVKKVDETSLATVADSIRAKAGITDQLVFPSGFVSAVQAIQAGEEDYLAKLIMDTLVEYSSSEVTRVVNYSFAYKSSLKKLSLPNAKSIENHACESTINLEELEIPNVEEIFYYGFYLGLASDKLKLTQLPSIKEIGSYAFVNRTGISINRFPNTLNSIGTNAFRNCLGITELTFEGTPSSISASAFDRCNNLLTINVPWSEGAVADAPWGATNATINYDYVESE